MDDADLVEAARRGEDSAWGDIYDRYADRLHDHCHRILRDRDEAADALHDAFLAASRNLHQLRDPTRLRPWLYSICRHTSLKRVKARDRVELTDAPDEMTTGDGEPDRGVRQEELAELVWAAAAGLNGRDQALLDLNLRQGLEGQDLADAMGTSLNNSYVMLSRMRDQVERSLGALLIARLGRDECSELDGLLQGWDGKFSPLLRKRVARHVDGCALCSEKRKAVVNPLALLGLAPIVPAPTMLKTRVISSIRNVEVFDPPHVRFTKDGYAALESDVPSRRVRGAWLATAAAVLIALGGFVLAGQIDNDPQVTTTASEGTTLTSGERLRTEDTATSTTAEDDASTDDSTDPEDEDDEDDLEEPGGSVTTKPGVSSTTSSTRAPEASSSTTATTAPPRVEITDFQLGRRPIYPAQCPTGPNTVFARAFISGSPSKVQIVVTRVGTVGVGEILPMQAAGNGTWTITLGPFPGDTDVYVTVQAYEQGKPRPVWIWDAQIEVAPCPSPQAVD